MFIPRRSRRCSSASPGWRRIISSCSPEGAMDAVTIDVELETAAPREEPFIAKLQADMRARLKTMMGLTCEICLKQPGEVPRSQGKAVRVKDLRKPAC